MVSTASELPGRGYHFEMAPATDGQGAFDGWDGRVVELRWCVAHGNTPNELVERLVESVEVWIEAAAEGGKPIPEPRADMGWGGEIRMRLAPDARVQLLELAQREGGSPDGLAAELLAQALAQRSTPVG